MMSHLKEILNKLNANRKKGGRRNYAVPRLWLGKKFQKNPQPVKVNPYEYFSSQIEKILHSKPIPLVQGCQGEWSRKAIVYNLFVRLTTAFDHDQNGKIDFPENVQGFRETGSFLKTIAILPYLKNLGVNTLHLLPITAIGKDGQKGNLGSPYAIRNPFLLDEHCSEPFLRVGVETEFAALVEAAHHLGIRVVVEFVFRTASKDSDWVKEHPEWFYWIKDSIPIRKMGDRNVGHYGPPIFPPNVLKEVKARIARGQFSESIPPPEAYRQMFTEPPSPAQVQKEPIPNGVGTRWVGVLKDGTRVKIPGAFADWPPDDIQPPWDDVTYLKLYDDKNFNYLAYNTLRMYDPALAQEKNINRSLWETIIEIIPFYQKKFGIDGVMIDMGHALPLPLLAKMEERAREINPDFAFWEENFNPTEESKKHGYNAAIGYLWSDEHDPAKLTDLLKRFSREKFPVPFFGTAESHNSPRAASRQGGILYSKFAWAINNFLPVIPFIHTGFELGEKEPVNTGLNFSAEEIKKYPAEKLPLFSLGSLNWQNSDSLCEWIKKISTLRTPFSSLIENPDPSTFRLILSDNEVVLFERKDEKWHLVVAGNMNRGKESVLKLNNFFGKVRLQDLIAEELIDLSAGEFILRLPPGEVRIFQVLA